MRTIMDVVSGPPESSALIGESAVFAVLRSRLPAVAKAQRTTLISGQTGTGKDVIARTLHQQSERRGQPYVTVHCAALPEPLLESEMFGHARGAFTGATQARAGLIRTASEGTLFLDEIDSLPQSAQAKMLRFLETGEYRPVGADRAERSGAWVIAATNQDLGERVREGTFRADLLFRLAVVRLDVPPLRAREDDVVRLAEHFLRAASGDAKRFDEEARRALLSYDWPGNVRELKHRVESAALFSEDPTIGAASLNLATPPSTQAAAPPSWPVGHPLGSQLFSLMCDGGLTLSQAITMCERLIIEAALTAENNNRTRAAGRLGIHVRTIFKKLAD